MRVAEDQRPPREDVVDVAVAVDVDEIRTFTSLDEQWPSADRLERPYRRTDAAGHETGRLLEEPLRPFGRAGRVGCRHRAAPASERTTERAASSPEAMQSGMPPPP